MSILDAWVRTPAAAALGWTLIHSLWEGALVALILAAALRALQSSRARYAAGCLAMIAMLAAFTVTFTQLLPSQIQAPGAALSLRLPPVSEAIGESWPAARASIAAYLPWLAAFWIAGVLLFHLRGLLGWMATRRLRHIGVCSPQPQWPRVLDRLRARLRLARPVILLESCLADVPVVIGYLRPVILMPVGLLAGLSAGQVEAILLHELAHIRRHDYLVNLLQIVFEGLVFYHPAVWWISGVIRAERENCCDDVVVALRGGAHEYAAALAALEQNRWAGSETALAATGGSLVKRVRRLLAQPEGPRAGLAPVVSALILTLTLVSAMTAWQNRSAPKPASAPAPVQAVPAAAAAPQPQAKLLAQARPQAAPSPQGSPYDMWLKQDVAYIITDEERAAFKNLLTNEEREHFIEQFWQRRDPTPESVENEFKEEYYRRIAYANDHFATSSGLAGWKTDRGRIYITYGPPDEKESHPSGGSYRRPAEQGGGTTTTYPFEQWLYRYIQGVGTNVIVEFIDPALTGEYRMTSDPSEKDTARATQPALRTAEEFERIRKLNLPPGVKAPKANASVQARGSGAASISLPLDTYSDHKVNVTGRILTLADRLVTDLGNDTARGPSLYTKVVALPAGVYRLQIAVTDTVTGQVATDNITFEVK